MKLRALIDIWPFLIAGLVACSSARPDRGSQEAVISAYAQAVQTGAWRKAYALTSSSFQKRYNEEEFVRLLLENKADLREFGAKLQQRAERVHLEATLIPNEGGALLLVQEQGEWKIASSPLEFYSQRTPAEAIRSFIKAIERRRYDIIVERFVPAKRARTLTKEMVQHYFEGEERDEAALLLRNLKANIDASIHLSGNTATMPYGERSMVRFLLEDGLWKIENPN
jgi:hypothetical protein